jgi:hypothetical protein
MRHALLSSAIAAGPRGMGCAAATPHLVALASLALILAPSIAGTTLAAIDLAAIATATDEHLRATAGTQKEAARPFAGKSWREEP